MSPLLDWDGVWRATIQTLSVPVVRRIIRPLVGVNFVAPLRPALDAFTSEELQERSRAARLDDLVNLLRLPGVLLFAGRKQVDLSSARL